MNFSHRFSGFAVSLALVFGGCVTQVVNTRPHEVPLPVEKDSKKTLAATERREIESPTKAHMFDGTTILFPDGVLMTSDSLMVIPTPVDSLIYEEGRRIRRTKLVRQPVVRYGLDARPNGFVFGVPIDSVMALEAFEQWTDPIASFFLTTMGTAAGALATAVVGVAIFGSCPTVYWSDGGEAMLQSELFSNSISSLLELRDVDATSVRPDSSGHVELEVRNEALETHYINHLELVEVSQSADEVAVPGRQGQVFLLSDLETPAFAHDRAGRDVSSTLTDIDSLWYSTSDEMIAAAIDSASTDYIDLTFARPPGKEAAIEIRVRSSLLKTVLFYESMLADQGAESIDWLIRDMNSIGNAMEVGTWFSERLTLKVKIKKGDVFVEVGRMGSFGPIAWEDHAVRFDVPDADSIQVRLEFAADGVRIDRVRLANQVRVVNGTPIPIQAVFDADGNPNKKAFDMLARPDEQYLITGPGTAFTARFDVGMDADSVRSFFLAGQGYYIEWVRGDWLQTDRPSRFQTSSTTLARATGRWNAVKEDFEQRFYDSKIPVR